MALLFIFMPIVLYIIGKIEFALIKCSKYWSRLANSVWYTYGTFLGEGITCTVNSEQAWAIRKVLHCFKYLIKLFSFLFSEWV